MLQINIRGNFYNVIKSSYPNSTSSVRIGNSQTRSFQHARGVRQGCILSPLLFNLYVNDLAFSFNNNLSDPFVLPNGTKLNSLFYADDLIILSRSKVGLQNCLRRMNSIPQSFAFSTILSKSEVTSSVSWGIDGMSFTQMAAASFVTCYNAEYSVS